MLADDIVQPIYPPVMGVGFPPAYPYDILVNAHISIGTQGRRYMRAHKSGTSTTVPYARYLMAVKQQRLLTDDEEADHIDNDRFNDRIDNIQLLTHDQHVLKTSGTWGAAYVRMICPICGARFRRRKYQMRMIDNHPIIVICCRLLCSNTLAKLNVDPAVLNFICENQVLRIYTSYKFDYDWFFHAFYPHTDLYFEGSKALLDADGELIPLTGISRFYRLSTEEQVDVVRTHLTAGMSQQKLAPLLGIGKVRLSAFVEEHLPEFREEAQRARKLDIIRALPDGVHTLAEIGVIVGMYQSNLATFINGHAPELISKVKRSGIAMQDDRLNAIRNLPDDIYTAVEIGAMVGVDKSNIAKFIKRHAPELMVKVKGSRIRRSER